jgi:hypothetical protein
LIAFLYFVPPGGRHSTMSPSFSNAYNRTLTSPG